MDAAAWPRLSATLPAVVEQVDEGVEDRTLDVIHSVLIAVMVVSASLWIDYKMTGSLYGSWSGPLRQWYGFFIGAVFSGVVGVGFYPLLGSRVWCRFGCPQAAILGFVGAGGIGQQMYISISLFLDSRLATLTIATFILVNGVDLLSGYLRRRLDARF